MLPDKLISDIKKARWGQILRTMPGAVDVLSLSVEAGLDFQVAMQRFVERGTPGALRDEFSNILNDMRLGKTRAEAIREFGRRVGPSDSYAGGGSPVPAGTAGGSSEPTPTLVGSRCSSPCLRRR